MELSYDAFRLGGMTNSILFVIAWILAAIYEVFIEFNVRVFD